MIVMKILISVEGLVLLYRGVINSSSAPSWLKKIDTEETVTLRLGL